MIDNQNTEYEYPNLEWRAFQYSLGELPADERAAFEACLADDQAAREALAEAVELTAGLTLPLEDDATDRRLRSVSSGERSRWSQPVGWMALGAAACFALVVAWKLVDGVTGVAKSGQTATSPSEVVIDERLALAWGESQMLSDQWIEDGLSLAEEEFDEEDASELATDKVAPDWMLAAVTGLKANADGEMPDDMELEFESPRIDN
jgi:hypothetical protein